MSKSLAELRKEKDQPASRPTAVVNACLDQSLLADIQRLTAEKGDILTDAVRNSSDGEQAGPPRKMGEGPNPRLAEIDAELEVLYQRLRDTEGEILLTARDGGSWARWKDANPAREDNDADDRFAFGVCNATALMGELSKYAVSWEGDDFGPGEWDWFSEKVAPADLARCVREVVRLHESEIRAPKSPSASSAPTAKSNDSGSPAA